MGKSDLAKNIFLVFLGVALTFSVDYLTGSKKSLSYEVISKSEIVNTQDRSFSGIQILVDTTIVRNVNSSILKIYNDGDIPIRKSDFDSKIVIGLDASNRILRSNIVEKNPRNLNPKISVKDNLISIEPLLLNANDHFILQILSEGNNDSLFINARIAGIESIVEKQVNEEEDFSFATKVWFLIFTIAITFVYTSINTSNKISPNLKGYRFIHWGELAWNQLILFIITVLMLIAFLKIVGIDKVWLQLLLMVVYLGIFNEGFKYVKTKGYNKIRSLKIEEIKDEL